MGGLQEHEEKRITMVDVYNMHQRNENAIATTAEATEA